MTVTVVIAGRCTACGWPRCSGYISFGQKLHERHCSSCLSAWEALMRGPHGRLLTLAMYRDWQKEREIANGATFVRRAS
jgi:hypothetical protein